MDDIKINMSCEAPNKIVFPNLPPKRTLIHQYSKTSPCKRCSKDIPLCRGYDYKYCSSDDEYDLRIRELHSKDQCNCGWIMHEDNEISAFCADCDILQLFCPECFQSLKFLGYDGTDDGFFRPNYFDPEEDQYLREISESNSEDPNFDKIIYDVSPNTPSDEKEIFIARYSGDKNLDYADATLSLTGEDGGYYHYWKCEKCKKHFSLTDK